ncbi:hypothetical protein GQ42DRAFT_158876 [Ramicandelaber brevisporus]|nr:hypothetical protein GQ42DRAFT_158876 [Ramicandelaber brevisporus]
MLERVAGCLPHLTTLYLYGGLITLVDSDWLQTTSLVDTRSSKLRSISFSNFTLAPRLFEVLLALPSLRQVSFWQFVIPEPELIMSVFKKHRETPKESATVGIISLTISFWNRGGCWSTELMLEMIACLPHLKSCAFYGNDSTRSAIKEKHPHIRL